MIPRPRWGNIISESHTLPKLFDSWSLCQQLLLMALKKYFFQLNEPYIPAKLLQISFTFSLSASIYQVNVKLLIPVTLLIPEFIK